MIDAVATRGAGADTLVGLRRLLVVAVRQRVAVEGLISYRPNGAVVEMSADLLTVFPKKLPTVLDVAGIWRRVSV